MSTRSEKEKQKTQQEKFQAVLSNLLKDDDNKYCVDCDAKGPRWASWNLGVFLCIRCAGIHRNLGVHISKVKSVNLDTWTPEQISMMMEVGNSRARAAYEVNLPVGYRRPQTDSALESFIRAKYEQKKYIAKDWVPPKPTISKVLLDDDRDKKKIKPKGQTGNIQLNSADVNSDSQITTQTSSKAPNPKPVQMTQVKTPAQPAVAPPSKSSTNTDDLIGLETVASVQPNISNNHLDDFLSGPLSSSQLSPQTVPNQVTNGSLETNLFSESNDNNTKVSTKDSIMALYGGQPTQQQFGVPASEFFSSDDQWIGGEVPPANYFMTEPIMFTYPDTGGLYMPQQAPPIGTMYGMPSQQTMHMQQGMYGNPMNRMGTPQASMAMGTLGMQPQNSMVQPQRMAGVNHMNGQQGPIQQMQFQQMPQQMTNRYQGQPQMGWSGAPAASGHTLSTNLWQ